MKNKKLIYILLPLAILIWGAIFYKLFYYASPGEEWITQVSDTAKKTTAILNADTFSILADYRDPFLGNVIDREPAQNEGNEHTKVREAFTVQAVQWPDIVYGGMIKNQRSARELALLKINGKESILKTGEMAGGLELLKISKDSVEIKMLKQRKWVRK